MVSQDQAAAKAAVAQHRFQAAVLDVGLPDGTGVRFRRIGLKRTWR